MASALLRSIVLCKAVKIVVAYIAVTQGPLTADFCSRFVGSYLVCPPGVEHDLVVVCNGGPLPLETSLLFDPLNAVFLPRPNDGGWDISGYQETAQKIHCDMLVCLGESVYFHRPDWLLKMVNAWNEFGPGMYGFFSSFLVRAHLNTTAFVTAPLYLQQYPKAKDRASRYEFEHGTHSLWRTIQAQGRPAKLVTWDGVWDPIQWRLPKNILWRGTQENCLIYCNHTDRYRAAAIPVKKNWERGADQMFK